MPTLTLDNIYAHIPGVGNLDESTLWEYLGDPRDGFSNVDVILRAWVTGKGRGPPSWRQLLYAVLRTHESLGWDQIKFCTPEGRPNYIPIVTTCTVLYC